MIVDIVESKEPPIMNPYCSNPRCYNLASGANANYCDVCMNKLSGLYDSLFHSVLGQVACAERYSESTAINYTHRVVKEVLTSWFETKNKCLSDIGRRKAEGYYE